uniref:BCAS3 domain-containing protein n=1 Tax=Angiostrongylus cantonensis TaxID=6313 RepID=A0A0K0D146_ANGCA
MPSPGVNDCLLVPTCIRCFVTKNPPRPLLVFSNKARSIMFVDLSSRKCAAELNAPQSIHEVETWQSKDNAEVILTSFTGAQWIIPLENGDRGVTEEEERLYRSRYPQASLPNPYRDLPPGQLPSAGAYSHALAAPQLSFDHKALDTTTIQAPPLRLNPYQLGVLPGPIQGISLVDIQQQPLVRAYKVFFSLFL